MYTLTEFNNLSEEEAKAELFKCCGSNNWVHQLMHYFPFKNEHLLFHEVRDIWYLRCQKEDYLESFEHHPKIGDVESAKKDTAGTEEWADKEQAGVKKAASSTIRDLAISNEAYFNKFGYIFIICATGKSAEKMLQIINIRLDHDPEEELNVAMGEQHKITLLRLQKLFKVSESFWHKPSQITSHVLDTSIGKPGEGIRITLKRQIKSSWHTIALGITNNDGRAGDLLPPGVYLTPDHYRLSFDTGAYFKSNNIEGFYPEVTIDFNTFDQSHYHVPLLVNPFGYSTYRGS